MALLLLQALLLVGLPPLLVLHAALLLVGLALLLLLLPLLLLLLAALLLGLALLLFLRLPLIIRLPPHLLLLLAPLIPAWRRCSSSPRRRTSSSRRRCSSVWRCCCCHPCRFWASRTARVPFPLALLRAAIGFPALRVGVAPHLLQPQRLAARIDTVAAQPIVVRSGDPDVVAVAVIAIHRRRRTHVRAQIRR